MPKETFLIHLGDDGVRSQEGCKILTEYSLSLRVPFLLPILISNIMTITLVPFFLMYLESSCGVFRLRSIFRCIILQSLGIRT